MKKLILLLIVIVIVIVIALLPGLAFIQTQPANDDESVQIELYSDPFPMFVGPMELIVSVTDAQGRSIEGAEVSATTELMYYGSPPITDPARRYDETYYYIPIIWTSVGQASVIITAELPDGRTVSEEFIVFVYINPPENLESRAYRSESEIQQELETIPDNEYWIVVPHGAREITDSFFVEFVPELIELSVSGQNTLVIRNDDYVDNQIGPFYVAAGETLRQRFDEPGVFQGTCTINQGVIRIEVGA